MEKTAKVKRAIAAHEQSKDFYKGDSLPKALKKRRESYGVDIKDWVKKEYSFDARQGLSFSASHLSTEITQPLETWSTIDWESRDNDDEIDEKQLDRAERTIAAALDYIRKTEGKTATSDQDLAINPLAPSTWYAYFISYQSEIIQRRRFNEPFLTKAVVQIHEGMDNKVTFKNHKVNSKSDLIGYYAVSKTDDYGVTRFDLQSPRAESRHLHMKLYLNSIEQEYAVGQYVTFKDNHIQSGSICFQRTTDSNPKSQSFRFVEGPSIDHISSVPKQIVDFITPEPENIFRIEKSITNSESLQQYLDERWRRFSKASMTIEKPNPQGFIASSFLGGKKRTDILKKMTNYLNANLKKVCSHNDLDGAIGNEDSEVIREVNFRFYGQGEGFIDGRADPYRHLDFFRTLRFFILILDDAQAEKNKSLSAATAKRLNTRLSYSHIQLGLAVAVVKVVIVIGRENQMTETIRSIEDRNFKYLEYKGDLETEWKKTTSQSLRKRLLKIIRDRLPTSYTGYIDKY